MGKVQSLTPFSAPRVGRVWLHFNNSVNRSRRRAGVAAGDEVAGIEEPAIQLSTELSDLFPETEELLVVVGRTFPDRDPAEVLEAWAETVSKIS